MKIHSFPKLHKDSTLLKDNRHGWPVKTGLRGFSILIFQQLLKVNDVIKVPVNCLVYNVN